jgi:branched-subunit amino acid aminotransferase/4-amino-4-deoxychorismate lyase
MKKVIFCNGEFLASPDAPVLSPDSGLLRGIGLFETMRAYNGNIIYFNRHIVRLKNSCKVLGLEFSYDAGKMQRIIRRLLEFNLLSDARLRLSIWKEKGESKILVAADRYNPHPPAKYRKGFSVTIARLRQNEDSFLAQHKTTSRLIYEVNFSEAQKKGFDEAIMLNQRGYITEATRSNIFFAKNKTLFTPALDCGCLNGITRRTVFDLAAKYAIKIYEDKFTLGDLCAADAAFLTNSLMGLMPVTSVEKKYFIRSNASKMTGLIMRKYRNLLGRMR